METIRHALVVGLGRSGVAAARLLLREGARVVAVDGRAEARSGAAVQALCAAGLTVYGEVGDALVDRPEVCVVSPGIALDSALLRAVQAAGVPLLSELELGWRRLGCPVVAVTGSNGKSTAVKWCAESLAQAGYRSVPAGNYGVPVSEVALAEPAYERVVLEVSSFQLETVQRFAPEVAVVLNVLPNHLDRHGDMARYVAMKARIFENAGPETVCLVPWSWSEALREAAGGGGVWQTFGTEPEAEWRYAEGRVWHGAELAADLSGTFWGRSSMGNAAAAMVGALSGLGVSGDAAVCAARGFMPLPYRLQEVGEVRGVRYVNDSKSTNWAATAFALDAVAGPVRLIAGGQAKDFDDQLVKERLSEKVTSVYLIGSAAEALASAWSCIVPCVVSGTLRQAIREVSRAACDGETVLFSPGCASFDQFRNYEERGEQFTRKVHDLVEERVP